MRKNIVLIPPLARIACCGFLFWFSIPFSFSQTPNWVWAKSSQLVATGAGVVSSEGYNVATDNSDNAFVTGNYPKSISFGSIVLPIAGAFLTKYDSSGNVLWAKSGIDDFNGVGYGLATDASGNCYLSGYFSDTITFGSYSFITTGGSDIFLVKYDPSGNVLWAKTAVGHGISYGAATDAFGNIYITGVFASASFTLGTTTLTNAGNGGVYDIFLAKYDSSGNLLWAKSAGGPSTDYAYGIATDASGNVCITGMFGSSTISFGSYSLTNVGAYDIFLAKYDSSGNVLWAKSSGGSSSEQGFGLCTDASQNIYMTGYFDSPSISFGSYTLPNAGQGDAFLVKYDSSGNVGWAKSIGSSGNEMGWSVSEDKHGRIYLTGSFNSPSLLFDTITILKPAGVNYPMFIAGYNSSGNALWAKALASGGDDQNAVAASPSGAIYVGGDFDINTFIVGSDTLTETGGESIFVAKLFYSGLISNFTSSDTVFCSESGKCINFFDHSTGNPTSWQWIFPGATPDSSIQQNPTSICYYQTGTYPVTLIVANGSGTDTLDVSPLIISAQPPAQPTITSVGDTLYSSHASYYQWYFNGSPITGATDSFYICSQSGLYAVQITDGDGCNSLSTGVSSCITGINEISNNGISIFPNPASQAAVISWQSAVRGNVEITVVNVLGEKIYSFKSEIVNRKSEISIDVSALASGIYFVRVQNGSDKWTGKLLKD